MNHRHRRPVRPRLVAAATLLGVTLPFAAAAAAAAAPAAAAARSQQQPVGRQDAVVEGIVVHQDGSPAEGVAVSVVGHDSAGLAGIIAATFTLGLGCIPDSSLCFGSSTEGGGMATSADGSYHNSLPDSYVAGTETDTDWVVTAALPAAAGQAVGPRSSFEFEVNIAVQAAPPLPLWEQTPTVSVDGWRVTATVDGDLPPGTDRSTIIVGGVSEAGTTATVDLRHLESGGRETGAALVYATASADVRVPHANGRTIYHQGVSTAAVTLPALDLVPPSWGVACTLAPPPPTPEVDEGCPVTDGSRTASIRPGVTSITVDLPAPVDVSDVFLANGRPDTVVEASADGTSWVPLANDGSATSAGLVIASPTSPVTARFVRVSRSEGLDGLAEVSVWSGPHNATPVPPAPASTFAPASTPSGPGPSAAGGPTSVASGGNSTATLVGLLVGLAVVGGAAAGIVALARRRGAA